MTNPKENILKQLLALEKQENKNLRAIIRDLFDKIKVYEDMLNRDTLKEFESLRISA